MHLLHDRSVTMLSMEKKNNEWKKIHDTIYRKKGEVLKKLQESSDATSADAMDKRYVELCEYAEKFFEPFITEVADEDGLYVVDNPDFKVTKAEIETMAKIASRLYSVKITVTGRTSAGVWLEVEL